MESQTSKNRELYELDRRYKEGTNLIAYIDEVQDFYNGKQYPNDNYNNMPRVTMNICSLAAITNAAKLVGTPLYMTFTSDNPDVDCSKLQRFDEYNCKKLKLDVENYQSCINALVNGTEITYWRWDEDDTSYKGIYKGGLALEHIDIRNFAVANPYIQDLQNQKWVMFWEDMEVGAVKELVEGKDQVEIDRKCELITRNEQDQDGYKDLDAINHSLVTVYTRFFKVDGEVYFMCSTENVDIFKYPHPLSNRISERAIRKVVNEYNRLIESSEKNENGDLVTDYRIDYEDVPISVRSKAVYTDKEYRNDKSKFSLYPFTVFRPYKENRSFYGRSYIRQMIPIQKGINFCISMLLMAAQNNAYNKIIAKPDAIKDQVITNEPSQIIYDFSQYSNSWGIKFAETQPIPNVLLDFAQNLLSMTRVVYGFSEVMDGTITNKDMSGWMLQQMIKQANTSIEQQQKMFWAYNEDGAAIRLQFYQHYVDEARYTYEIDDVDHDLEKTAQQMLLSMSQSQGLTTIPDVDENELKKPVSKYKLERITGDELYGTNFDICFEALQGTSDSKLVEQQTIDDLFKSGVIASLPPDLLSLYIEINPSISPRLKTIFKKAYRKLENKENQQLKGKIAEMTRTIEEMQNFMGQMGNQLKYQQNYNQNLQKNFTGRLNAYNGIVDGLMKDLDKYRKAEMESQAKSQNSTSRQAEERTA